MVERLSKPLGVVRGTALLLNIVIGAGLLTLPGLAVERAGRQAVLAWLLCGAAALPLLVVFVVLGSRYPDAGGIVSYARRGFGALGARTASLLFLGAVVFGLPSIALSGGYYLSAAFGGSPTLLALGLLLAAALPHLLPGEGAARAMAWIASTVLAAVLVFLCIGLVGMGPGADAAPADTGVRLSAIVAPFTMLFFAFTGWEVGAGIAEEFRDPERDFPKAMLLSYAIACALYVAVAFVTMRTDLHGHYATPFVEIVRPLLGGAGGSLVAITAALIVFANLSGAVWGVSRLVYSTARDGGLPAGLAAMRAGRPLRAVAATVAVLTGVLGAAGAGAFSLPAMLALAGQNLLILSGMAAGVLAVLARTWRDRTLGIAVLLIVGALLALQGARLAYPVALFGAAAAMEARRFAGSRRDTADTEA